MNPVIDTIFKTGKVEDDEGNVRDIFPVAPTYEDGKLLYDLIRKYGARETLETGMALGVSSLFICQAVHDNGGGRHSSVDPWQEKWFRRIAVSNLRRAGLDSMHRLFQEPSYLVLPRLLQAGEQFDFIFIDGNHRFEYVLLDVFYAQRLLRVGGHMILHDSWLPALRKIVAFIARNFPDVFELAPECLGAPASLWRGMLTFAAALWFNPYDACVARFFARRRLHNTIVFQKTSDPPPETYDQLWDFYRSF